MSFRRMRRESSSRLREMRALKALRVAAFAAFMLLPVAGQDSSRTDTHPKDAPDPPAASAAAPAVPAPSATAPAAAAPTPGADALNPANGKLPVHPDIAGALTGQQKLVAGECADLLKLATGLKAEVDKTTKDTLSIAVVRDAGAIEQLAHKMRDETRTPKGPR